MRYSQSFSRTRKEKPAGATTANHELLIRGGFIDQEMAGVYSLLPWGLRVLRKIEQVVREEMNAIGGQELLMPALQSKAHWEATGRWKTVDVLFKIQSRHDKEYALGPTHEEIVTPIAKERIKSYRDLPLSVYQIQTKYRDEERAKSGIIRGREFGMKDLYSFHTDEKDLDRFYQICLKAYLKIFDRLGINAKVVEASGGDFTKQFTHEFMAISDAGEDRIYYCSNCPFAQNVEIAQVKLGTKCPSCKKGTIGEAKAIEIGNIFKLGTKFSEAFGLKFVDKDGKTKPVVMGSYGIGTTRLIGTLVELFHDTRGIIWPVQVAPFKVHLVGLNLEDEAVRKAADDLDCEIYKAGVSILYDDREAAAAGEKLADADLIGAPARLVISKKTLAKKSVEFKPRNSEKAELIPIDQVLARLK